MGNKYLNKRLKRETLLEIEQEQVADRNEKTEPALEDAAQAGEADDLDWIPLDNGWQLVIWDEEDWAEMGLSLKGFARIIDRLQEACAGQPPGDMTLPQGELETALTKQAVCLPQDPSPDLPKISPPSKRVRRSPS